eukprot:CAMPEP_0196800792 /NCGR_PEP_ID=MMETSP1362-20130617/219_1 /TAXON_ID=163516 /ORGANISM="Leptocylindrus danicus, Strain CCMP1856" /LENGTH=43 /DNA_ID= /DNA_START= /DNA_END= /DNA_ORIENTATION=
MTAKKRSCALFAAASSDNVESNAFSALIEFSDNLKRHPRRVMV